jgi:hypothetical protein
MVSPMLVAVIVSLSYGSTAASINSANPRCGS